MSETRIPSGVDTQTRTQRAYDRERYYWCKTRGYCVACYHERALPGRVVCGRCLEKRKDNLREWRHSSRGIEYQKEYAARRRQRFIEAGLCAACGGVKENSDLRLCERCRINKNAAALRCYHRNKAKRAEEAGQT